MSEGNVEFLRVALGKWQESGSSFEAIPVDLCAEDVVSDVRSRR